MMEQRENIVAGHMAGGDVTITNVSNAPPTYMARLKERFEYERANSVEFRSVIDSLQYYQEPVDQEPISLQQKLALGKRRSCIPEALRAKELFVKCMARHSLSETAQEVMAYCLGQINQLFQARIVPLINEGKATAVVDAALVDQVIQPVLHQLEENILGLMPQELKGMVYYLTANCFLWWHQKDANVDLSSGA
jgi:hypothetical protein